MNIFYLDRDPVIAASMVCDRHSVKMVLESAQMLSTAVQLLIGKRIEPLYKVAHQNHPSTIWTRASKENYDWHIDHFTALMAEYEFRYDKQHKSGGLLPLLAAASNVLVFDASGFTDPPQCMPEIYRCDDTVTAYRNYYMHEKSGFAKWKMGNVPEWYSAKQSLVI